MWVRRGSAVVRLLPLSCMRPFRLTRAMATSNPSWQQTMYRIKDPKLTLPFYQNHFGMTLVDEYHFEDFSLYFLTSIPEGEVYPHKPGTPEAHQFLWNMKGTTLELTHNHGTENQADFKYNNGNVEPNRGFGHIAFNTDDVYAASEELEKAGVAFQKKPNEGRMKGLAFALDPDGYWVEIVKRAEASGIRNKFNLSQTMIRVKDPKLSLPFYQQHFGMKLIRELHFPDAKFSLYFLATLAEDVPKTEGGGASDLFMKKLFQPVLELTHNHGTESDPAFSYHNGNTEPRGFGHLGFLVDNVYEKCEELEKAGYSFQKKPDDGRMKGLAFVKDPDGYWIEVIPRGFSI
eukprot:TRINITY_DN9112_c0_g2_i1.p1 TRINITY_DN9112_c0_g2~~TRINITY_DN9112_c0_g2_i1.p1  ORF type:complete len:346 (+),score=62.46 TRINITY_DN9112_c0_g2_i1:21-1058(+)